MATYKNINVFTLTGAGSEIPALAITDPYNSYLITGTAIALANYTITYSGVPQLGDTFEISYNGTLDITTNGTTFSILGTSITQAQLLKKWILISTYNGSSWDTNLYLGLNQSDVISSSNIGTGTIVNSNIANNTIDISQKAVNLSVTTAKINDLAVTTGKINDLAVTDAKLAANSVITSKVLDGNITNAKLSNADAYSVIGNNTGIAATPQYVAMATLINANAWSLTGNSGTVAGTNFVGTTDAVDLVFKVNNTQAGRIDLTNVSASFGLFSLNSNITSAQSAAFGAYSLQSCTIGDRNTGIGYAALNQVTSGSYNTSVGADSSVSINTGSSNTAIGENALSTLESGDYNTAIGCTADVDSLTATNRIALGYGALADTNYQFALPDNVTAWKIRGNSFTLPSADGSAKAVLQTDGSKALSFGKVIDSDVYTPTLTNGVNVAASTAYQAQWMRIGNVVTVSGKVSIDPTAAAATATELGMSLPVASNFANEYECAGTAASEVTATVPVRILADTVNNRASFQFASGTTANDSYSFTFTYTII